LFKNINLSDIYIGEVFSEKVHKTALAFATFLCHIPMAAKASTASEATLLGQFPGGFAAHFANVNTS
jgi:hypothetical protein